MTTLLRDPPAGHTAANADPVLFLEPADAPPATPFRDWIRRPDVNWRYGWERPDLDEVDRWWARTTFEGLPIVPEDFHFGQPRGPTP
jgi:hypothetical protein